MCLTLVVGKVHAQYYSVNYDKQTVAAMAAAFGAGAMAESYYNEQVGEILKHYNAAEVATAGIFAAKFLERKAFTDLGIWSSSTENYYYRRIHNMVANKIMPKIWTVAGMMLKSPQTALYWGSYLMKICADTKSLCMQFESVVTNSSLTFADIQFLEINQEIAAILKLSEIGNVDWQQLLDDIASVPGNFTVENLTADIETLYNMGASLATAGINGASDALLQQSAFNDLFNGKVSKIIDIYDNYHDLYEQAENGIGSTLLGLVGGEDNVAALFDLSNYNITTWMTDYLNETQGNYYTQRWYIARRDQGSVSLCDYYPPTDDNSILNGDHWYRINTSDPNFYPSSTQREQILTNSENHAGWSRSRVQQLNAQNDGFTYTMNYWMSSYIISRGGTQTKKAYAYEIHVTKSWNNVEEVYEEVFDSYSMDLNTFKRQLQARLSEYNDNEEGYVYYIGSDAKRYYQATDAAKLKGVESVTISVTCSDGVTLGQGSTQYKCRECGGSLNAHSKECAMRTTVTENELDLSELDEKEREASNKIALLESQISQLEQENRRLATAISNASVEEAPALRQQYNANKTKIDNLKKDLATWQQQLADIQNAKSEAADDNATATDDYYRIPAIMQDVKSAYNLTWQGAGSWNGYTYVRTATMPNINGIITFKATLSIARKPKYFLGIKIHRAILQISWELTSEYTDTQVVDVLPLDPNASDEEKTRQVNNRISEIAQEFPSCSITTEYAKSEAANDNATATDDYYRIPAIMQDVKSAYNLTWQGAGSWNGYTYVRTATMPNINGIITFKATLSIARKPKYFLGIKIHRAILQISWELTSEYTNTQVVDVLTLDPNASDEEKTRQVNNRISEIAQEFPSCSITTEYAKSEATQTEDNDDVIHLLWSSDRLEIAREVDSRITKIYADLVSLEKMMHYKRSFIDVLMDVLPEIDADQGRRRTLIEECYERWRENADPNGDDNEDENGGEETE